MIRKMKLISNGIYCIVLSEQQWLAHSTSFRWSSQGLDWLWSLHRVLRKIPFKGNHLMDWIPISHFQFCHFDSLLGKLSLSNVITKRLLESIPPSGSLWANKILAIVGVNLHSLHLKFLFLSATCTCVLNV